MASKHVRFSNIDFFKEEEKLISRGENAVDSGHVNGVVFDGKLLIIRGNVHASMKDRVYKVEIKLDSDHEVEEATCTCPRGQLICHHMAALLIYAFFNVSVTDVACSWGIKKQPTCDRVETIDEKYGAQAPHQSIRGLITREPFDKARDTFGSYENVVACRFLLRK
uniref:Uncharacterized protein LOC114346409 n=1 Tax=Diabrotica virgifera virgifera TaxID=50390 RepID=A0A6P7HAT4_DIAVI